MQAGRNQQVGTLYFGLRLPKNCVLGKTNAALLIPQKVISPADKYILGSGNKNKNEPQNGFIFGQNRRRSDKAFINFIPRQLSLEITFPSTAKYRWEY